MGGGPGSLRNLEDRGARQLTPLAADTTRAVPPDTARSVSVMAAALSKVLSYRHPLQTSRLLQIAKKEGRKYGMRARRQA